MAALVGALGGAADGPDGARLVQAVVLGLLCLGLIAAIADRLADREIVGVAFIAGMNVGHIAMLVALAGSADVGGPLVVFCGLMLAGDLVKLVFLASTGFTVRSVPRAAVYGLVGAYAAGYAALIVIELVAR